MLRVALNGFGRIGKNFLRAFYTDPGLSKKISIVAINIGKADVSTVAYMFKYDTTMGTYPGTVTCRDTILTIDGHEIKLFAELDAQKLPWKELSIDWIVEASGHYTHRDRAMEHITSGAKKVLITAPAHNTDISIIMGINEQEYKKDHKIISLGSCTSNALLPLLSILDNNLEIERAYFTSIHAYTNSQHLLDVDAQADHVRASRAAAVNIIPSSTGASEMIGEIIPHLTEKVTGTSVRVPVIDVSLLQITYFSQKKSSREDVIKLLKTSSQNRFLNILTLSHEELVSSDYRGNASSLIIDIPLVNVHNNSGVISAWYDNEWGYSNRLKDFLVYTLNF